MRIVIIAVAVVIVAGVIYWFMAEPTAEPEDTTMDPPAAEAPAETGDTGGSETGDGTGTE